MGLIKRGTVWYIRYWVNGKEKWETVGPNKRQAELALAKRKVEVKEGRYFDISKGLKWTYNQLIDRYLEYARVTKKASTYRIDIAWAKPLREAFGSLYLRQIAPHKVLSYMEGKLASGLAPATVAHHLALLKHSLTMATKWDLLPHNPLHGVQVPVKVNNARLRYLTPNEIPRLLKVCSLHLWRIVVLALCTGMRRSEVLNLGWSQVDFSQRLVLLTDTKNRETRGVPLSGAVVEILKEIKAEQDRLGLRSPWVFPNPKTGRPYGDCKKAWSTALKRAEIENFHFHDLRHTAASYLRMTGADLITIKEILGHKDIRMTTRYAHISPTYRLAAVDRLEAAILIPPGEENRSKNRSN